MVKLITSCCGKPISDCPGCAQGMELIMQDEKREDETVDDKEKKQEKKQEKKKEKSHPIFNKIDEGIVTVDDFNKLISEATPEAVRDRVRRRTLKSPTKNHIDSEGHQQLGLPKFAARVQPKRERANNTQMTGQGKAAHRRSTRTQRRKAAAKSMQENLHIVTRYLIEEEKWKSEQLLLLLDEPWKWYNKIKEARDWYNERSTRRRNTESTK